jgi:ABC-type methionine transport system permease subunit
VVEARAEAERAHGARFVGVLVEVLQHEVCPCIIAGVEVREAALDVVPNAEVTGTAERPSPTWMLNRTSASASGGGF